MIEDGDFNAGNWMQNEATGSKLFQAAAAVGYALNDYAKGDPGAFPWDKLRPEDLKDGYTVDQLDEAYGLTEEGKPRAVFCTLSRRRHDYDWHTSIHLETDACIDPIDARDLLTVMWSVSGEFLGTGEHKWRRRSVLIDGEMKDVDICLSGTCREHNDLPASPATTEPVCKCRCKCGRPVADGLQFMCLICARAVEQQRSHEGEHGLDFQPAENVGE